MFHEVFSKYPSVEKVIVYGSRARGDYRKGSDIDLTMIGNITDDERFHIAAEIDALPMPYLFDISIFTKIKNENLIEHIKNVGQVFYEKI
jgi:predicted nucleotidyltransferase